MAHIQRRGKDRWRARYIDPNGYERSRTFSRKIDAEKFLATVEVSKLRGEWVDPRLGKTTFRDWAEEWMTTTVHHKPKTRDGHVSLLRTHLYPTFGQMPLAKIQTVRVRKWVADTSAHLSPARLRQAHWLLSKIMKTAVESGYLARSPCVGVRLPHVQKREKLFLTANQVHELAEAIDPRYKILVLALAYCGLRWGEACALRRRRCDFVRSRMEIAESLADVAGHLHFGPTKTYQVRWVAMPGFLRDALMEQLGKRRAEDPDALVFTAPEGGPLRSCWRRRFWKPAVRAAGLPDQLRIHDLRHTCAALLIQQGAHPKAIQAHLGHSSITVTMDLYGHLFPDDADRLAEGLDTTFRQSSSRPETACGRPGGEKGAADQPATEDKSGS